MIELSLSQIREQIRKKLLEEQEKKFLQEHEFEYPIKTDFNDTILSDAFSTDIDEGDVVKYFDKSDQIERTGIVKAILGSQARIESNGEIHFCPIPWIDEVNGQKINNTGSVDTGSKLPVANSITNKKPLPKFRKHI